MTDSPRLPNLREMPREDAVKEIIAAYGWDKLRAEHYVAIVTGEIKGDIVEVGKDDAPADD